MKRHIFILVGIAAFVLTALYVLWPNAFTEVGLVIGLLASVIQIIDIFERQKESASERKKHDSTTTLSKPTRNTLYRFTTRIVPEENDLQAEPPSARPLPTGSFVPYSDYPKFLDRTNDLRKILVSLRKQPVVIHGTAGIGKTSTALEFCYQYGSQYQGVYWLQIPEEVNSLPWHKSRKRTEQKKQSLAAGIAECGKSMDIARRPRDLAKQVDMTLKAWNALPRVLIVIDNLNDPQVLRDFVKQVSSAEILVTSIREEWPADVATAYRLKELDQRHSIQLLRQLAPRLNHFPEEELSRLAERLGNIPLALDLAGNYLDFFSVMTIGEYIQRLTDKGTPLADPWAREIYNLQFQEDAMSIIDAISVSQEALVKTEKIEDRVASDIFLVAGYCMPNSPIPLELLSKCVWDDRDNFSRGLQKLYKLGMLESPIYPEHGPIQHPFLAGMARMADQRHNGRSLLKIVNTTLEICAEAYNDDRRADLFPLGSHLQSVAEWAQQSNRVNKSSVGALWYYRGNILREMGAKEEMTSCYELSIRSYQESISKSRRVGARASKLARDYYSLGLVYELADQCSDAAQQFEEALRLASRSEADPKFVKALKQARARVQ